MLVVLADPYILDPAKEPPGVSALSRANALEILYCTPRALGFEASDVAVHPRSTASLVPLSSAVVGGGLRDATVLNHTDSLSLRFGPARKLGEMDMERDRRRDEQDRWIDQARVQTTDVGVSLLRIVPDDMAGKLTKFAVNMRSMDDTVRLRETGYMQHFTRLTLLSYRSFPGPTHAPGVRFPTTRLPSTLGALRGDLDDFRRWNALSEHPNLEDVYVYGVGSLISFDKTEWTGGMQYFAELLRTLTSNPRLKTLGFGVDGVFGDVIPGRGTLQKVHDDQHDKYLGGHVIFGGYPDPPVGTNITSLTVGGLHLKSKSLETFARSMPGLETLVLHAPRLEGEPDVRKSSYENATLRHLWIRTRRRVVLDATMRIARGARGLVTFVIYHDTRKHDPLGRVDTMTHVLRDGLPLAKTPWSSLSTFIYRSPTERISSDVFEKLVTVAPALKTLGLSALSVGLPDQALMGDEIDNLLLVSASLPGVAKLDVDTVVRHFGGLTHAWISPAATDKFEDSDRMPTTMFVEVFSKTHTGDRVEFKFATEVRVMKTVRITHGIQHMFDRGVSISDFRAFMNLIHEPFRFSPP